MELADREDLANEDWEILKTVFPTDWERLAEETGALKGLRKNKAAGPLLRTLLMHIGCGYSLRETVTRARLAGIADLSDVALLKRLRKSCRWLQLLATRMLFEHGVTLPTHNETLPIRIFDASVIREPGKTGSQWRLHYSLRLPTLECDYFNLTPAEGVGSGETLNRFPISKGDYVIVDRGYSSISGILYTTVESGAYILLRWRHGVYLEDAAGNEFSVIEHVKTIQKAGVTDSWKVVVRNELNQSVTGRLCAIRKSKTAISQSQEKLRKRALKKQANLGSESLEMAKYVVVFTTFPEERFDCKSILDWYRVRWQIELVFKRFKSIAQLGHLPKHDIQSSKAWLYGKLFLALASERLIRIASDFSPWGYKFSLEEKQK